VRKLLISKSVIIVARDSDGNQEERRFHVEEIVTLRQKRQAQGNGAGSGRKTVAQTGRPVKCQLEV
jgi:hypothetical protein